MKPTVLVVEDDRSLRDALCATLELGGYRIQAVADGCAALEVLTREGVDVVVSDVQMPKMDGYTLLRQIKSQRPDLPVLLMTAYGTIQNAVQALQTGALDYLVKPFEAEVLVSKVAELLPRAAPSRPDFVVRDPSTREVYALAERVAESDATVLISGESGAGKEVLFRFLHTRSKRCSGPAIAINCAAIPENMLEAMLFGYEKGAFTGAYKACPGKFEQAQGGTLLLDEVSEMSLPLQAKLLRVLQEKEVERLGGNKMVALDVRVVATTNRNMRAEIKAGRFREDLFYRLNVFPLRLPPLRERRRDIIPLAEFLLIRAARTNGKMTPSLGEDAQARLLAHHWPGNVRELDNVIQRALIIQRDGVISARDLHIEASGAEESADAAVAYREAGEADSLGEDLKQHERRLILDALQEGEGSRAFAARKLGISPRTLRYKIAQLREQGYEIPAR
jgi:two-component system response regulator FlrC